MKNFIDKKNKRKTRRIFKIYTKEFIKRNNLNVAVQRRQNIKPNFIKLTTDRP